MLLQDVMEQTAFATSPIGRTLFTALLDAARTSGSGTPIIEDIARAPLTYKKLIQAAIALGRPLATLAQEGGALGVMLPNSNGAVATFMALQAFARVPAMLNVSAGPEAMLAACTAADIRTVITARTFVERGKLGPVIERMQGQVRFVYLDDIRARIGLVARLRTWFTALRPRALPGAPAARPTPPPPSCSPAAPRARLRASCSATATSSPTSPRSPR